jgi:crossover junction endodeoxyribonuclease RusA
MDADWVLHLPWRAPPLSLNRQPGHPVAHSKVKQEVKTASWALAKNARIPALSAIMVELVWYPGRNGTFDGDNMAPTLKYLIDGLVQARVIPDDDSERVLSSRSRAIIRRNDPYDASTPRLVLAIQDASALGPMPHYAPKEQA